MVLSITTKTNDSSLWEQARTRYLRLRASFFGDDRRVVEARRSGCAILLFWPVFEERIAVVFRRFVNRFLALPLFGVLRMDLCIARLVAVFEEDDVSGIVTPPFSVGSIHHLSAYHKMRKSALHA